MLKWHSRMQLATPSPIVQATHQKIMTGHGHHTMWHPSPRLLFPCTSRLAYLIFTSGSTGKPKAVMIRHKSALNVVRIWGRYVGLHDRDRFAQVASMSWDVHVIEVYGTMAARATSVTCPDMVKKGPDMQAWLKERHITGMSVVPSHLRTMAGGGDASKHS